MARVDLTIRGGGIFGLACAWEAAKRGARVRLIETSHIGAGSSGGIVGALSPHLPENWNAKKQFQLESLLMAQSFWSEVEAVSGRPSGYARLGRLQALASEDAIARARGHEVTAAQLWNGQAEWRVIDATAMSWAPQSPTGALIFDTLSARLHPKLATSALAAAIIAKGGEIVFGSADSEGPVIWATGFAGLQDLNADLGQKVGGGVKGQAVSLHFPQAANLPQLYVDGLHIIPHLDGTVAIGSTSEREWTDQTSVDAQLDELLDRALAACPVLEGADVVERWAGIRPRAKSRAPMLGRWPGRDGHFVANGGFKIGFGMAPKVAKVMIDLVLEGHDAIPDGFRVEDSF